MTADRRAEARLGVDQLVAIDRVGHRLAHLGVVERLLAVVGRQDHLALGRADDDGEARVLLQALDQLGRLETGKVSTSPASSALTCADGSFTTLKITVLSLIDAASR